MKCLSVQIQMQCKRESAVPSNRDHIDSPSALSLRALPPNLPFEPSLRTCSPQTMPNSFDPTFRHRTFLYTHVPRGGIVVIVEACPPPDMGEATEKLYERHYLVSKIVSSFFCLSDKFYVSLSVDLQ